MTKDAPAAKAEPTLTLPENIVMAALHIIGRLPSGEVGRFHVAMEDAVLAAKSAVTAEQ